MTYRCNIAPNTNGFIKRNRWNYACIITPHTYWNIERMKILIGVIHHIQIEKSKEWKWLMGVKLHHRQIEI